MTEQAPSGSGRGRGSIAFLLTPKSQVVWVRRSGTLAQAITRMKPNGFSAVPLLDDEGGYVGTLTEGDILWYLLEHPGIAASQVPLCDVPRHADNAAVHIDAKLESLLLRALEQNFVPVVDDREAFIGIVRRRTIIAECALRWLGRAQRRRVLPIARLAEREVTSQRVADGELARALDEEKLAGGVHLEEAIFPAGGQP